MTESRRRASGAKSPFVSGAECNERCLDWTTADAVKDSRFCQFYGEKELRSKLWPLQQRRDRTQRA